MKYLQKCRNRSTGRAAALCLAAALAAALLGGCGLSEMGTEPTIESDPILIPSQTPVEAALAASNVPYEKAPYYLVELDGAYEGVDELSYEEVQQYGENAEQKGEMEPSGADMDYQQAANHAEDLRLAMKFPDLEEGKWLVGYMAPIPTSRYSDWPAERGQYVCSYGADREGGLLEQFRVVFDSINGTVAKAGFDWSCGNNVPENNPYYLVMQTDTMAAQNLQAVYGVVETTLNEKDYARKAKEANDWAQSGAPLEVVQETARALGLPADGWEPYDMILYPETFQDLEQMGESVFGFPVWYERASEDGVLRMLVDSRTHLAQEIYPVSTSAEVQAPQDNAG